MDTIIEDISIDQLELSVAKVRVIPPKLVSHMQDSMFLQGQLQPVVVRREQGRYQVIDGFKRIYAAIELGWKSIRCYVLDVDLKKAKLLVLLFNRGSQKMEVWEEAMVLADLAKTHELSQRDLAELTGYSRSWVCRRLSLLDRLSSQLIPEIRMGLLSSSQARELIKLPRCNQMKVARVIQSWDFSSRKSTELVGAFLKADGSDQERNILTHPLDAIRASIQEPPEEAHDDRLSNKGNELLRTTRNAIRSIGYYLHCLRPDLAEKLQPEEKIIIMPELTLLADDTQAFINILTDLLTNKLKTNERSQSGKHSDLPVPSSEMVSEEDHA